MAVSFAGSQSEIAVEKGQESYGNLCPQSIDSALFAIVTSREAYEQVIPSKRHRAVGKADATPLVFNELGNAHQEETGETNYIERFNCTMRQRVSRLVRNTLSFSKKIENHLGAIWYFIHHYNKSLPL